MCIQASKYKMLHYKDIIVHYRGESERRSHSLAGGGAVCIHLLCFLMFQKLYHGSVFLQNQIFFPASIPPRQPLDFSSLIVHSHLQFISASSFYFLSIGGYRIRLWRRTMNIQLLFIVLYCFVATADARKLNKIKEQLRLNCYRPSFLVPKYIHNQTEPPNLILYQGVSRDLCGGGSVASPSSAMTSPNHPLTSPPTAIADHVWGNTVALLFFLLLNENKLN